MRSQSVCLSAVAVVIGGCTMIETQNTRQLLTSQPAPRESWPHQLAGRSLQVKRESYVLYANDPSTAATLAEWLDTQVVEARSTYGQTAVANGVIFAIEGGEEPMAGVEDWHRRNILRARHIEWVSPTGNGEYVVRSNGRPYCWNIPLYFRESFSMPYDAALRIGVLGEDVRPPGWICFLTTDEHFADRFAKLEKELRKQSRENARRLFEDPRFLPAFLLSLPALPILALKGEHITRRYREIDCILMHFQRREVAWEATIGAGRDDDSARQDRLATLRVETDEAWRKEWFSRPID